MCCGDWANKHNEFVERKLSTGCVHSHCVVVVVVVVVMLDKAKFPDSSIAALNSDTHGTEWDSAPVQWSLVADGDRFHVFLVAALGAPLNREVRIDWRALNRLEFEPYVTDARDERIRVDEGETRGFCRLCTIAQLRLLMHHNYHLFAFNCRTVSYLLLTEGCRFDAQRTLSLFEEHDLRCGVGSLDDCLSVVEIQHYIRHKQSEAAVVKVVDK